MDDISLAMLYRIMLNGVAIEADSPEAAVALARATAAMPPAPLDPPEASISVSKGDPPSDRDRWSSLLASVTDQQRTVLELIKSHPKGISTKDLAEKMGKENTSFIAGVIYGGLVKNLRKANIKKADIFLTKNSGKESLYLPGPLLLESTFPTN